MAISRLLHHSTRLHSAITQKTALFITKWIKLILGITVFFFNSFTKFSFLVEFETVIIFPVLFFKCTIVVDEFITVNVDELSFISSTKILSIVILLSPWILDKFTVWDKFYGLIISFLWLFSLRESVWHNSSLLPLVPWYFD